jgi:hypothetical protein
VWDLIKPVSTFALNFYESLRINNKTQPPLLAAGGRVRLYSEPVSKTLPPSLIPRWRRSLTWKGWYTGCWSGACPPTPTAVSYSPVAAKPHLEGVVHRLLERRLPAYPYRRLLFPGGGEASPGRGGTPAAGAALARHLAHARGAGRRQRAASHPTVSPRLVNLDAVGA